MKLTELLGRMEIEADIRCWYDFDEKCIKLSFVKHDSASQCRYGVVININPCDIPKVREGMAFSEWKQLKAVKKD